MTTRIFLSCRWIPLLFPVVFSACQTTSGGKGGEAFFVREVKPILEEHCSRCHMGQNPLAMNLTNRTTALEASRPFIIPGKPEESLLIQAATRPGSHQKFMPPVPISLTEDEIGVLEEWITAGAAWPTGPEGTLQLRNDPENP